MDNQNLTSEIYNIIAKKKDCAICNKLSGLIDPLVIINPSDLTNKLATFIREQQLDTINDIKRLIGQIGIKSVLVKELMIKYSIKEQ